MARVAALLLYCGLVAADNRSLNQRLFGVENGLALDAPVAAFLPIPRWAALALLFGYLLKSLFPSGGGRKVSASHILVASEALCQELAKQLRALPTAEQVSAKFAALAKEHSSCPSGKSGGGALGTFTAGQMVPAFDKVCWEAPVGAVMGPVQTQFGFHLIVVTHRDPPPAEEEGAGKKAN